MEHRYIGKTGLRVSPICLGTMTFGTMADKKTSFEIMDKARDKGVNFFDTAELYPVPPKTEYMGETERIIGEWMRDKPRDSFIIASKVVGSAPGWFAAPNRHRLGALDRFHIRSALENSLKNLKTDYIDLYQIHWPDPIVPIEETLEVLDELIREGKIRYIGASNHKAYELAKANECSRYRGYKRFESIQNNFSLLNPRFFDELDHLCKKEEISLLPYSPIGAGVLSGKYNDGITNGRFAKYINNENPRSRAQARKFVNEKTLAATKEYLALCKKFEINPVTFAVAWSKQHDFVASTIIGATMAEQLDDSLGAMDLVLSNEILEEVKKIQDKILYPLG
ncbi:MAG: aldo/keto reductase [Proteobacteria bacterium]|nr:MAG: aldo/keto reductase [Pseudomonadota bacterium]